MKVKNLTDGILQDTVTGVVFQRGQVLEVPYEQEARMRDLAMSKLVEIIDDVGVLPEENVTVTDVPAQAEAELSVQINEVTPEDSVEEAVTEPEVEVAPVEEVKEQPYENKKSSKKK